MVVYGKAKIWKDLQKTRNNGVAHETGSVQYREMPYKVLCTSSGRWSPLVWIHWEWGVRTALHHQTFQTLKLESKLLKRCFSGCSDDGIPGERSGLLPVTSFLYFFNQSDMPFDTGTCCVAPSLRERTRWHCPPPPPRRGHTARRGPGYRPARRGFCLGTLACDQGRAVLPAPAMMTWL